MEFECKNIDIDDHNNGGGGGRETTDNAIAMSFENDSDNISMYS
jgi:hypothetical protein